MALAFISILIENTHSETAHVYCAKTESMSSEIFYGRIKVVSTLNYQICRSERSDRFLAESKLQICNEIHGSIFGATS